MSVRVPSRRALFDWLHLRQVRYVALRDGTGADDLDLLLDDDAVPALRDRFRARRGLKVDVYGVEGRHGSGYHGYPHLPPELARRMLGSARLRDGRRQASAELELLALLYHAAYHKPVQSGLPFDRDALEAAAGPLPGPYGAAIETLCAAAGEPVPRSLLAMHRRLQAAGLGLDDDRLLAYLQHDFRHGRKSMLHAWLADQRPGELNLFVIRAIAVRHGLAGELLQRLRDSYEVLAVKPIPLWTRLRRSAHMRGGKWKRGGRPHVAVVVFDPRPLPRADHERELHPFVFNSRQFLKQAWREWFAKACTARSKDNPIHSTDNEAEALGHLPLFFDAGEQHAILHSLAERRAALAGTQRGAGHAA